MSPPECLRWEQRRYRLLEEMLRWNPDILCLQEVDHFDDWFSEELGNFNFTGLYVGKPVALPGGLTDGCAIFFSRDKFELLSSRAVNYVHSDGLSAMNQVALVSVFHDKKLPQGRFLIVATTHLKAEKTQRTEEIRALQIQQLMSKITNVKDQLILNSPSSLVDIVVCGDFNSPPSDQNGIQAKCFPEVCNHPLRLCSVFQKLELDQKLNVDSFYTTWKIRPKGEVKWCIDYVMHSAALGVMSVSSVPTEQDGLPDCRLPSFQYPSDHLALAVDFVYQKPS